jgi:hypothetical protein
MAVVRYSFTLDPFAHRDIVNWLELQPSTTEAVRAALQAYVRRPGHAEIEAKLDEVLEVLRGVKVVGARSAGEVLQDGDQGEPVRAARGLDAMLGKFRNGRPE